MPSLQIKQRYQEARANWMLWRSLYDEAYAYAIPNKNPYPEKQTPGIRKNNQAYDITAVNSTRRLVSRLHASLVPPGEQWFELEAGEQITDPNERKQINAFLQQYTAVIFQALNDSNFDLAINEMLQDLTIGTGAMMVLATNNEDEPIKFKSVAVDGIYPEGDAYDEINTVFREFKDLRVEDIPRLWKRAKLTQAMETAVTTNPLRKFCLIEGVIYDAERDQYNIVVFEEGSGEYLLDIWSKSSPWVVARWSKSSNEVAGRGPVIEALPTIRSLNVLTEEIMRNVALSTSPPWMAASDGVFNPYLFQIEPNKVIPVSRQSMGSIPLERLDVASDIRMGTLEMQDLRQQVKDALFDNPIRPVDSPSQTATEIMVRQQNFLEDIGPAFGRLSVELLPKIINRVIYILQRKGRLPNELSVDNKNVSIKYKSPLVRSAAIQKVQNLQNYVAILQPILGQELTLATLNVELIPEWMTNALDVEAKLVKSPAELGELSQRVMTALQPPPPQSGIPSPTREAANEAIQNPVRQVA